MAIDVHRIARRLASLPETTMRAAVLCDTVCELEPADAAWLLDVLATAGRSGGPPFDVSLLAAVEMIHEEKIPYEIRRAIFEEAERGSLLACKELLLSDQDLKVSEDTRKPRALIPGQRPLTLGERKSLARSWDRTVLERLLGDPNPDVVGLLLDNPRLTESDVLRISSARRASGAVLRQILGHKRWKVRPRIRLSLLRNPKLPEATALRLVGLVDRATLRELRNDPLLPQSVRDAIARRLQPPA